MNYTASRAVHARTTGKALEAREQITDSLKQLSEDLAAGRSETLMQFLDMLSRFHRYSFGNVMLILSQRPEARRVAGYRTWQRLGRQVRKGERGIVIIAPMLLKPKGEHNSDDEPALRFRAVSVFDVSQTDGEDLPEPPAVSGDPGEYYARLVGLVESFDISLNYELLPSAKGLSSGGHIVLDERLDEAERFAVLVHELAHELLHWDGSPHDARPDYPTRELEAEAVAYTVGRAIGLDIGSASSDYIQVQGGDADLLGQVLDRVQKASATILDWLFADESEESQGVVEAAHA